MIQLILLSVDSIHRYSMRNKLHIALATGSSDMKYLKAVLEWTKTRMNDQKNEQIIKAVDMHMSFKIFCFEGEQINSREKIENFVNFHVWTLCTGTPIVRGGTRKWFWADTHFHNDITALSLLFSALIQPVVFWARFQVYVRVLLNTTADLSSLVEKTGVFVHNVIYFSCPRYGLSSAGNL